MACRGSIARSLSAGIIVKGSDTGKRNFEDKRPPYPPKARRDDASYLRFPEQTAEGKEIDKAEATDMGIETSEKQGEEVEEIRLLREKFKKLEEERETERKEQKKTEQRLKALKL